MYPETDMVRLQGWGKTIEEVRSAQPCPTTLLYTSYLRSVVATRSTAEGLAALLPCFWVRRTPVLMHGFTSLYVCVWCDCMCSCMCACVCASIHPGLSPVHLCIHVCVCVCVCVYVWKCVCACTYLQSIIERLTFFCIWSWVPRALNKNWRQHVCMHMHDIVSAAEPASGESLAVGMHVGKHVRVWYMHACIHAYRPTREFEYTWNESSTYTYTYCIWINTGAGLHACGKASFGKEERVQGWAA